MKIQAGLKFYTIIKRLNKEAGYKRFWSNGTELFERAETNKTYFYETLAKSINRFSSCFIDFDENGKYLASEDDFIPNKVIELDYLNKLMITCNHK